MAKAERRKQSSQKIKLGFFAKLLILILAAAMGWQLYNLRGQVEQAEAEKQLLAAQVQQQQQANDKLQEDIAAGPTPEKIEEIARDELGLLGPGDRVFQDVSN